MAFSLPEYHPPAFLKPPLSQTTLVRFAPADGVAPESFNATLHIP